MNVYLDLVPIKAFRRRKWRQGNQFLLTLIGMSITTAGGEVHVEPVYLPLAAADRRGSLLFIELAWGRPRVLAVVSPRPPFLHFERLDRIRLEEEV